MNKYLHHALQAHWMFVIITLVFGVMFIKVVPPLWGLDETSQFARVYQIAHGQILPHVGRNDFGGRIPTNLNALNGYVIGDLVDDKPSSIIGRKDVDNAQKYKTYAAMHFSTSQTRYIWTASYSPVAYIGQVTGALVARVFNASIGYTLFLARLGGLVLYAGLVCFALWTLRCSRLKWLIFLVGLLPVSIFQASVVTADSVLIGLSLLFVSILFRLLITDKKEDNRLIYALLFIAVLLPLIKINYILISFTMVLIPARQFGDKTLARYAKYAVLLVSMIAGLIWDKITNVTAAQSVSQRPDGLKVNPSGQIVWMVHHIPGFIAICSKTIITNMDSYLQQIVGLLGWNYVAIPNLFIFILLAGLIVAALYAKTELIRSKKHLVYMNMFIIIGVASIFPTLYSAFNPVGYRSIDGVQGRYFIPFITPIVALVAIYLPVEVKIKDNAVLPLFSSIAVVGLATSFLYYHFAIS